MDRNPLLPLNSGPSGWGDGQYEYACWVPCITGQLSFSLIGETARFTTANLAYEDGCLKLCAGQCLTANPNTCSNLRQSPTPHRFVVTLQHRRSTDIPLPSVIVERFKKWAAIDLVLVARTYESHRPTKQLSSPESHTLKSSRHRNRAQRGQSPRFETLADEIGVLEGTVYAYLNFEDEERENRRHELIKKLRVVISEHSPNHATRCDVSDVSALGVELGAIMAEGPAQNIHPFRFDIKLFRDGELRIDASAAWKLHYLTNLEPEDQQIVVDSLTRQVYYFIKDATHRHYHHDTHSDNILPVTPCSSEDDVTWRRETLWALARTALSFRRSPLPSAQKHALGVLAYAESFQAGLARRIRSARNFHDFLHHPMAVDYDFEHTRQSLRATHDVNKDKIDALRWIAGIAITATLGALAFMAALVRIAEPIGVTLPVYVSELIDFSLNNLAFIPLVFVTASFLVAEAFGVGLGRQDTPIRGWIGRLLNSAAAGLSRSVYKRAPSNADSVGAFLGMSLSFAATTISVWLAVVIFLADEPVFGQLFRLVTDSVIWLLDWVFSFFRS